MCICISYIVHAAFYTHYAVELTTTFPLFYPFSSSFICKPHSYLISSARYVLNQFHLQRKSRSFSSISKINSCSPKIIPSPPICAQSCPLEPWSFCNLFLYSLISILSVQLVVFDRCHHTLPRHLCPSLCLSPSFQALLSLPSLLTRFWF